MSNDNVIMHQGSDGSRWDPGYGRPEAAYIDALTMDKLMDDVFDRLDDGEGIYYTDEELLQAQKTQKPCILGRLLALFYSCLHMINKETPTGAGRDSNGGSDESHRFKSQHRGDGLIDDGAETAEAELKKKGLRLTKPAGLRATEEAVGMAIRYSKTFNYNKRDESWSPVPDPKVKSRWQYGNPKMRILRCISLFIWDYYNQVEMNQGSSRSFGIFGTLRYMNACDLSEEELFELTAVTQGHMRWILGSYSPRMRMAAASNFNSRNKIGMNVVVDDVGLDSKMLDSKMPESTLKGMRYPFWDNSSGSNNSGQGGSNSGGSNSNSDSKSTSNSPFRLTTLDAEEDDESRASGKTRDPESWSNWLWKRHLEFTNGARNHDGPGTGLRRVSGNSDTNSDALTKGTKTIPPDGSKKAVIDFGAAGGLDTLWHAALGYNVIALEADQRRKPLLAKRFWRLEDFKSLNDREILDDMVGDWNGAVTVGGGVVTDVDSDNAGLNTFLNGDTSTDNGSFEFTVDGQGEATSTDNHIQSGEIKYHSRARNLRKKSIFGNHVTTTRSFGNHIVLADRYLKAARNSTFDATRGEGSEIHHN
jgi:hypothetical protein